MPQSSSAPDPTAASSSPSRSAAAGRLRIGCVVPTFNNVDLTRRCLRSLLDATDADLIVVVVDNASHDGTVAMVRREFPTVECLENSRNLGFAAGTNRGMARAVELGAEALFLLNNDAQVEPDCFVHLARAVAAHPDAGVFGCRIQTSDACFGAARRLSDVFAARSMKRNQQRYPGSRAVRRLWGCGMLVTSRCLAVVGGLDETFFAYDEDRDFCIRVRRQGFALRYVHDAVVRHVPSQATGGLVSDSPFRAYLLGRNRVRLWRKHGGSLLLLRLRVFWLATKARVGRRLRSNPASTDAALCGIREGLTSPLTEWPRFPKSYAKDMAVS